MDCQEFTRRDKFGVHNQMEVVDMGTGYAKARMSVKSHHLNGLGTVHGGAIFTLADLAFAAASNFDNTVTSINATIAYSQAAKEGVLVAEAKEITRNRKLVTYEARISTETGEVIAVFQGTGYIKRPAIASSASPDLHK